MISVVIKALIKNDVICDLKQLFWKISDRRLKNQRMFRLKNEHVAKQIILLPEILE